MTIREIRHRAELIVALNWWRAAAGSFAFFSAFVGGISTTFSFCDGKIEILGLFITGVIFDALFILGVVSFFRMLSQAKSFKQILASALKKYTIKIDIELHSGAQETLYCYYDNYYEEFGTLKIMDLRGKIHIYKEELKSYTVNNEMVDISTLTFD